MALRTLAILAGLALAASENATVVEDACWAYKACRDGPDDDGFDYCGMAPTNGDYPRMCTSSGDCAASAESFAEGNSLGEVGYYSGTLTEMDEACNPTVADSSIGRVSWHGANLVLLAVGTAALAFHR